MSRATPVVWNDLVIQDNILFVNTWTVQGENSLRGNQATFEELVRELDINGKMKIERNELTDDIKVRQRPESPDAPASSRAVNDEPFFSGFEVDGDGAFVESEWNAMWERMQSNLEDHGMLAVSLKGTGERPVTDIKWKVNEDTPVCVS